MTRRKAAPRPRADLAALPRCTSCGATRSLRATHCRGCARIAERLAARPRGFCAACAAPAALGGYRDLCEVCARLPLPALRKCALDGLPLEGHLSCEGCSVLTGPLHATASVAACPCRRSREGRAVA